MAVKFALEVDKGRFAPTFALVLERRGSNRRIAEGGRARELFKTLFYLGLRSGHRTGADPIYGRK
jgi:hypothetical protein